MPFGVRTSPVKKGEKFYACPYCSFACETKKEFRKHLKDVHDQPGAP